MDRGYCKCGPLESKFNGRHSFTFQMSNSNGQSNDEFTLENPTNAFGEISFSNTTQVMSKVLILLL